MSYRPIESYGVIGDLHTAALVNRNGSIDFMCFPRFDSPTVFAALLDDRRGGRFRISPLLAPVRHRQLYLPDSNVLLSRFLSEEGMAEITDFMPIEPADPIHDLVREVRMIRGELRFRMLCDPRFDYGRSGHEIERRGEKEVVFRSDRLALRLRSSVPLAVEEGRAVCEFTLRDRERAVFVLEEARERETARSADLDRVEDGLRETLHYWRAWVGRSNYTGRWREMVHRSALVLKLLTSVEFGSVVAAPTFGLPEAIGGVRNWDYRYTWIRDASLTLHALTRLGHRAEAIGFFRWIEERCREIREGSSLQVVYGIDGRAELEERELGHWEGYRRSRPVRIGNAASDQLQLDIYGELLDAVFLADKYATPISHDLWRSLSNLLEWTADNWRRPGSGIWEIRGEPREFVTSRLMSWVALDRGIRIAIHRSFPCPLERWIQVRDEIYEDIFRHFWNPDLGAFVQYRGARRLDAAVLLMPLVRFIAPDDPRWLSTLEAIERELVSDSLVYRYRSGEGDFDGLPGGEGHFAMCSFWYAQCLSLAGRLEKARFVFEKMLGYANHLGLYAEEIGPSGEHLGNFPQAFTHLALISAAHDLDERLSRAGRDG